MQCFWSHRIIKYKSMHAGSPLANKSFYERTYDSVPSFCQRKYKFRKNYKKSWFWRKKFYLHMIACFFKDPRLLNKTEIPVNYFSQQIFPRNALTIFKNYVYPIWFCPSAKTLWKHLLPQDAWQIWGALNAFWRTSVNNRQFNHLTLVLFC